MMQRLPDNSRTNRLLLPKGRKALHTEKEQSKGSNHAFARLSSCQRDFLAA
jgi:hypothetical protein